MSNTKRRGKNYRWILSIKNTLNGCLKTLPWTLGAYKIVMWILTEANGIHQLLALAGYKNRYVSATDFPM